MGGGEIAQERMAVRLLKTAAGVLVWETSVQVADAGNLLGRVVEAKAVRVKFRGDTVLKLAQPFRGVQLRAEGPQGGPKCFHTLPGAC